MPTPPTILILNPASGSGRNNRRIEQLAAESPWLQLRKTTPDRPTSQLVREALEENPAAIILSGGDGTIHDGIQPLAAHPAPPPIAIIPSGTANDLATALNIPTNPAEALSLLAHNHTRHLDLVEVTSPHSASKPARHFVNAASGGFSQIVADRLDPHTKKTWGPLAYFRAAIESAIEPPTFNITLTLNDKRYSGPAHALLIANGPRAGGFTLAPHSQPDDGLFDLLVLTRVDLADQLRLSAKFALGEHTRDEQIVHRRLTTVTVDSDPPITFSCDGETGPTTPLTFTIQPKALRIFTPPPDR